MGHRAIVQTSVLAALPSLLLAIAACGGGGGSGQPDAGAANVFDPDGMYLMGTLVEGLSGLDVLCGVTTPNTVKAGFPEPFFNSTSVALRRSDGSLLYLDATYGGKVMRFVEDKLSKDAKTKRWVYPANPEANDTEIHTVCDSHGGVEWFLLHPVSGDVWPACKDDDLQLYDASGKALTKCSFLEKPLAVSKEGAVLCKRHVIDPGGVEHEFAGVDAVFVGRAKAEGGFWAMREKSGQPFERWTIGVDGAATLDGTYPPIPDTHVVYGSNSPDKGALDAKGRFYQWVTPDGSVDQIMRFESDFSGNAIVYDEGAKPACLLHTFMLVSPQ